MKIAHSDIYFVIKRFPSHQQSIKSLYTTNQNFKTVCADYRQCIRALEFWGKADLCEAPKRQQEYKALLQDLESEILQYLEELSASETE